VRGREEPFVRFVGVDKTFDGQTLVIDDLNLDIRSGEFLTLLGPSGSGKTTTLMMLAGFEVPTRGDIRLAARSIRDLPPHERDIGVVFQNYALFPHMTVGENVAFPLLARRVTRADRARRVSQALDMVRLRGFETRRPAQLSGGQQQRVALARALIFDPKLVLMDEPLGALDKQLREHMQIEVIDISSLMFGYDASKLKDGPKTIADVFDTKKWPGRRGSAEESQAALRARVDGGWGAPREGVRGAGLPGGHRPRSQEARHDQEGHRVVDYERPGAAAAGRRRGRHHRDLQRTPVRCREEGAQELRADLGRPATCTSTTRGSCRRGETRRRPSDS
jgi:ABC-type nitrate/sulfonate/bicarbonate transport system ATPase subunit